jgi:phosphoglycerate dehydrogenase-like enzyme
MMKVAILDDYQGVALKMADWSILKDKAELTVFREFMGEEALLVEKLRDFEVLCVMRERTPMTSSLLRQLPKLKLIISTGMRNASINLKAAEELGIEVKYTGYLDTGAPELTWTLLLALARNLVTEAGNMRAGQWQTTIGTDIRGKTLGLVGLGRVGAAVAKYAQAFGMKVIAWSPHLNTERAENLGAKLVSKEELFAQADFVSVHLVLSETTRGIIGAKSLSLMKPTAYLVNTSRGPLIDEGSLLEVLRAQQIAGAALDVYDREPLGANHPFRKMTNVLATPHIGYVTEATYQLFYGDTVQALLEYCSKN